MDMLEQSLPWISRAPKYSWAPEALAHMLPGPAAVAQGKFANWSVCPLAAALPTETHCQAQAKALDQRPGLVIAVRHRCGTLLGCAVC